MRSSKFIVRFTNVTNISYCPTPPQQAFPTSGALVFIFNKFKACIDFMILFILAMGARGRIPLTLSACFLEVGGFPFNIFDLVGQFFDHGE